MEKCACICFYAEKINRKENIHKDHYSFGIKYIKFHFAKKQEIKQMPKRKEEK